MAAIHKQDVLFLLFITLSAISWLHFRRKLDLDAPQIIIMGYVLTIAWSFLACLIVLFRCEPNIRHWIIMRRTIDSSDPVICKKILDGTIFDSPLGRNQFTLTESRARPNQRLVRAFGIDNGFTTTEETWASKFKSKASDKLRKQQSSMGWEYMSGTANDLILRRLQAIPTHGDHISLNALIQSLTLLSSIELVSFHDPRQMDDDVILDIASCINELWVHSKQVQADCTQGLQRLDQALNQAQLDDSHDPRKNALNYLLPACETLWRVVPRCFIEVNFRSTAESAWRNTLTAFARNPLDSEFGEVDSGEAGVTVNFLVNEALRLYPPTRRIYREILPASETIAKVVAADIEACHRRTSIWGPDSDRFSPSRWIDTTEEMRLAFMPFGSKPFVCPAKPEFGPRMIGLLMANLARNISPREWRLASSDDLEHDIDLGDTPLDSARTAYGGVVLVRR
ncbi:cytochrome P450 [Physcia stellaris]|nr:cytochrome P450 [Physcia stellaris]